MEKVPCRTPTEGRNGVTNLPKWKFDCLHAAILSAVGSEGIAFSDLKEAVRGRLSADELKRMGSLGWHVTSVKLEMEVRGDIVRVANTKPQRLELGSKRS